MKLKQKQINDILFSFESVILDLRSIFIDYLPDYTYEDFNRTAQEFTKTSLELIKEKMKEMEIEE